jgi:hypothetical protein
MSPSSAALTAEIAQIRVLVSANVPLLSYWINRAGEVWKVAHKFDDGTCYLVRGKRAKFGRMSSLLTGVYTKI